MDLYCFITGKFAPAGSTACQQCNPGTFASVGTYAACTSCPQGMYSGLLGALVCQPCPINTYANTVGFTSCLACGPSKSTPTTGSFVCDIECSVGLYTIATDCLPCSAGSYSIHRNITACVPCAPGFYSGEVRKTSECTTKCPPGYVINSNCVRVSQTQIIPNSIIFILQCILPIG